MSYRENAKILKAEIDANRQTAAMVNEAGGIRKSAPKQSDKLGFDWVVTYVGETPVYTEYVPQEQPKGTAEDPILWEAELPLIPNAYYTHGGARKVWTGVAGAKADWEDSRWEVF